MKHLGFFGFANFYWQFIQGFSRITILFISILKTLRSIKPIIRLGKSRVGVGNNSSNNNDHNNEYSTQCLK